jgi:molecular chaperone GrpE (heat shock protein)
MNDIHNDDRDEERENAMPFDDRLSPGTETIFENYYSQRADFQDDIFDDDDDLDDDDNFDSDTCSVADDDANERRDEDEEDEGEEDDDETEDDTEINIGHFPGDTGPMANWKNKVLADFRQWLEALDQRKLFELDTMITAEQPEPDLTQLFGELVALRQEIRLQSKTGNNVNQTIGKLTETIASDLDKSMREITLAVNEVKSRIPEARRDGMKAVAHEFIPIVEGLERCLAAMDHYALPSLLFSSEKKQEVIAALKKPLEILSRKADENLRRLQIEPVVTVGDRFNSRTMRVIGVTENTGAPAGTVTEVCLQGYLLNESLIQTAEVKVEK